MMRISKKGQSSIEYAVVLIIIMGSFLAMQNYMKRGLQGRWRAAVDQLGDQYDPRATNSDVLHTLSATTNTLIIALNVAGGYWTERTDVSASTERKTGAITVGSY